MTGQEFIRYLSDLAPLSLAEEWDNVGLLMGNSQRNVQRVLTCLTLTADVAAEAVRERVDLIVTHHPILFRPIQRLTADDSQGRMLLELARAEVLVYSPHTAFDSALTGVNQQLAELFGLTEILPLRPTMAAAEELQQPYSQSAGGTGTGRFGRLETAVSLEEFARQVRAALNAPQLAYVGEGARRVATVGCACGAAAEMLRDAWRLGCDVLVTGEARFHACLEARALGIGLIVAGHYQTERPAIENLVFQIKEVFPKIDVWASRIESDPVSWLPGD